MNEFLNEHSLERACDEIAKLDIHNNAYDLRLFCEAALKYSSLSVRSKLGVDPLTLCSKEEWFNRCRETVKQHHNVDNDMAFIVVTHDIEWAARELHLKRGAAD